MKRQKPHPLRKPTSPDDTHVLRLHSQLRLKSAWESIIERYGFDWGDATDDIDLATGNVVVDRGHLRGTQGVVRIGTTVSNWPGSEGEEFGDEEEDEELPQEELPQEDDENEGAVSRDPVDDADQRSDDLVYSDDAFEDLLSSTPVFLKATPIPALLIPGIVTRMTPKLAVAKRTVTEREIVDALNANADLWRMEGEENSGFEAGRPGKSGRMSQVSSQDPSRSSTATRTPLTSNSSNRLLPTMPQKKPAPQPHVSMSAPPLRSSGPAVRRPEVPGLSTPCLETNQRRARAMPEVEIVRKRWAKGLVQRMVEMEKGIENDKEEVNEVEGLEIEKMSLEGEKEKDKEVLAEENLAPPIRPSAAFDHPKSTPLAQPATLKIASLTLEDARWSLGVLADGIPVDDGKTQQGKKEVPVPVPEDRTLPSNACTRESRALTPVMPSRDSAIVTPLRYTRTVSSSISLDTPVSLRRKRAARSGRAPAAKRPKFNDWKIRDFGVGMKVASISVGAGEKRKEALPKSQPCPGPSLCQKWVCLTCGGMRYAVE